MAARGTSLRDKQIRMRSQLSTSFYPPLALTWLESQSRSRRSST